MFFRDYPIANANDHRELCLGYLAECHLLVDEIGWSNLVSGPKPLGGERENVLRLIFMSWLSLAEDQGGGRVRLTYRDIARQAGRDKKVVFQAMAELGDLGLIRILDRGRSAWIPGEEPEATTWEIGDRWDELMLTGRLRRYRAIAAAADAIIYGYFDEEDEEGRDAWGHFGGVAVPLAEEDWEPRLPQQSAVDVGVRWPEEARPTKPTFRCLGVSPVAHLAWADVFHQSSAGIFGWRLACHQVPWPVEDGRPLELAEEEHLWWRVHSSSRMTAPVAAEILGVPRPHASKILRRLADRRYAEDLGGGTYRLRFDDLYQCGGLQVGQRRWDAEVKEAARDIQSGRQVRRVPRPHGFHDYAFSLTHEAAMAAKALAQV